MKIVFKGSACGRSALFLRNVGFLRHDNFRSSFKRGRLERANGQNVPAVWLQQFLWRGCQGDDVTTHHRIRIRCKFKSAKRDVALDHMQLSYQFITVCQTIIWHLLSGHVLFRNLKTEADNKTTDYKISQNAVQENTVLQLQNQTWAFITAYYVMHIKR